MPQPTRRQNYCHQHRHKYYYNYSHNYPQQDLYYTGSKYRCYLSLSILDFVRGSPNRVSNQPFHSRSASTQHHPHPFLPVDDIFPKSPPSCLRWIFWLNGWQFCIQVESQMTEVLYEYIGDRLKGGSLFSWLRWIFWVNGCHPCTRVERQVTEVLYEHIGDGLRGSWHFLGIFLNEHLRTSLSPGWINV